MRAARKLNYANVMSTIAVFVALGGASYAVVALPDNSVGTEQVKPRSLGLSDLSRKAVKALRGKAGPRGETGASGAAGATGAVGATGPAGTNGTNGTNGAKGDDGDVARWTSAIVPNEEIITTPVTLGFDAATIQGPSVTVTVPASGLVEVYARVHIKNDSADGIGSVGLWIDGAPANTCVNTNEVLISSVAPSDANYATNNVFGDCGTRGTGGPIMITTTPGSHTFRLVYKVAVIANNPTVHFSDRRLYVAPRP